ncbi:hypothetical protein [Pseudomonas fulva]|uniref:hypothetical protein n=1 Tax=Pseudomonas fulva TaxID=47880 RepID=UPI0034CE521D
MKLIDPKLVDPDVEPDGEKYGRMVRSITGAIPIVGGAATEAFNAFFESPITKRRTEWMLVVTDVINKLTLDGVLTEQNLKDNEVFVSAVAQSCNVALKTHHQEKLSALRSALISSASSGSKDEYLVEVFIGYVDRLTVAHIRMLEFIRDPDDWLKANKVEGFGDWKSDGGLHQLVLSVHPDFKEDRILCNQLMQDLVSYGLVNEKTDNPSDATSQIYTALTSLGEKFMNFISKHS